MTTVSYSATMANVRTFNTTGPVVAADHYRIPPLERIDLDTVIGLIRDKKYFVLHAPRQTGKTSALLELRDLLNNGGHGDFRCVYANVEAGQAMRDNVTEGMRTVLSQFALRASLTLGDDTLQRVCNEAMSSAGPGGALSLTLSRWAAADRKPLVLLIDEIDALVGDTLLSVLRQLRSGYDQRPAAFPQSIILCGVRDVRDYRIHSSAEDRMVLGGSAFNIKSESLRLGNFSEQEIRALLAQHTATTGQAFTEDALALIRTRTGGLPWLVNALCYDACFRHPPGRDRTRPITAHAILVAQERLILRRDTHIDDACDLGLVTQDAAGTPRIANPIYAEVVPRHLNYAVQAGLPQREAWYVDADGGLDVAGLLAAFQDIFREHSERWVQRFEQYHEAGPQCRSPSGKCSEAESRSDHGVAATGSVGYLVSYGSSGSTIWSNRCTMQCRSRVPASCPLGGRFPSRPHGPSWSQPRSTPRGTRQTAACPPSWRAVACSRGCATVCLFRCSMNSWERSADRRGNWRRLSASRQLPLPAGDSAAR